MQICLHTGTVVKLPITAKEVHGLAFDKSTKTLFYSETSTNSISYTTLHGENKTVLYTTGLMLKFKTYENVLLRSTVISSIFVTRISCFLLMYSGIT